MRNDPVLATRTLPKGSEGYRVPLLMTVFGGLHYIRGNTAPYFSLTVDVTRKGFPEQCYMAGAAHDLILKHFPKFADLAAMHGSYMNGEPTHAEANGWYWLAGSLGGAGERYHGAGGIDTGLTGKTEDECLAIFARLCRITVEQAFSLRSSAREHGREAWTVACERMKPRWAEEAAACIEKHGLVVYGDEWNPEAILDSAESV